MTAEPWFVDTNVFVYLFDDDSPDKQIRARPLARTSRCSASYVT